MLVTALVVAVLLLALGLALSRVISAGAQQNAIEYYGARSYLAAQSGAQRGMQVLFSGAAPSCALVNGSSYTFNSDQLANCNVLITCSSQDNVSDASVATGSISVYSVQSNAICSVADITASRTVVVEFRLED
ncbi:agglutinin biogenesis protein MshP [Pseudoalteromonas pernae]|uniref:agglutinin biogenesis protein MshP n=1 Tax=Pseudoalteromonas pernae TaxID=3118054 RepID=UPI0032425F82